MRSMRCSRSAGAWERESAATRRQYPAMDARQSSRGAGPRRQPAPEAGGAAPRRRLLTLPPGGSLPSSASTDRWSTPGRRTSTRHRSASPGGRRCAVCRCSTSTRRCWTWPRWTPHFERRPRRGGRQDHRHRRLGSLPGGISVSVLDRDKSDTAVISHAPTRVVRDLPANAVGVREVAVEAAEARTLRRLEDRRTGRGGRLQRLHHGLVAVDVVRQRERHARSGPRGIVGGLRGAAGGAAHVRLHVDGRPQSQDQPVPDLEEDDLGQVQGRLPAQTIHVEPARGAEVLLAVLVVPLALEIAWRARDGDRLHVQSEIFLTEQGARALLHGRDPYSVSYGYGLLRTYPVGVWQHIPYLPGIFAFGLPRALLGPGPLTDARVGFTVVSLVAALLALRRSGI